MTDELIIVSVFVRCFRAEHIPAVTPIAREIRKAVPVNIKVVGILPDIPFITGSLHI